METKSHPNLPEKREVFGDVVEGVVEERPKEITCAKGGHFFEHTRKALEVKCKKCPAGYLLFPGASVKDGHIYAGEQLLV